MAHYETFEEMLRSKNASVKGRPLVKKEEKSTKHDKPKSTEATAGGANEVAKKNTWLQLTNDTMVEIKKGEPLPDKDLIANTVTQKEYLASLELEDANEEGKA